MTLLKRSIGSVYNDIYLPVSQLKTIYYGIYLPVSLLKTIYYGIYFFSRPVRSRAADQRGGHPLSDGSAEALPQGAA